MATNDEVTLKVIGRIQSQNVVNSLTYEITNQSSSDVDILQSLVDEWEGHVKTGWLARHCDDYTLVGLKAFGKVGTTKVPGFKTIGEAGSVVADSVPSLICRTITLYGDSPNPHRRGRVMISATAPTMLDDVDGGVTAAEIVLMDVLATLLIEEIVGSGDTFQLRLGSKLVPALDMLEISAAKPRRTPASITSRRIRQFLVG